MDKSNLVIRQHYRSRDARERRALLQEKLDHYIRRQLENRARPEPAGGEEQGG